MNPLLGIREGFLSVGANSSSASRFGGRLRIRLWLNSLLSSFIHGYRASSPFIKPPMLRNNHRGDTPKAPHVSNFPRLRFM